MSLPTTIHTALYTHIFQSNPPTNFDTTKNLFPYLPDILIHEALQCTQPLLRYIPPISNTHPPIIRINNNDYTTPATYFTTWNISSLNTFLPCLQTFLETHKPAILTIQETKLTAKKSAKYLQCMFFQYKLIFNNTNTPTRYNYQQGRPYTSPRGGLLTFIHTKYAYPNNIKKIPTDPSYFPYLQILSIQNSLLTPILLLHLYMPSHYNDIHLIPNIMQAITQHITSYFNDHIILCGDFNRDIALIGHTENLNVHPPQQSDHQWRDFTQTLGLNYIPTNTHYTKQGGLNYTHTSLLDGYLTKSPILINYSSYTNIDFLQNSDHFLVSLSISNNIFIARPPPFHHLFPK